MSDMKQESKQAVLKSMDSKTTAEVTYIPDDGDPNKVTWAGMEFRANVPVSVPLNKTISIPMRKEHYLADGTLQSRGVETKVSIVDLAKGNPSFSVDGNRSERKVASARLPADADQYRGYALRWIRESTSLAQLNERWAGEEELRSRCGCEKKDENYLMPFFTARQEQVKEAA